MISILASLLFVFIHTTVVVVVWGVLELYLLGRCLLMMMWKESLDVVDVCHCRPVYVRYLLHLELTCWKEKR